MNNSKHLKKVLLNCINSLNEFRSHLIYNPESSFTRSRKLSLTETVKLIICMETGSLKDELYKYFGLVSRLPSSSAFIQQRSKIKVEAFQYLFDSFNQKTNKLQLYKGYRLLAVDGSTLPISYDPDDLETYSQNLGKDRKGHNAFHLHAAYDLLKHTYEDIIIEGEAKYNENAAFIDMIERYDKHKAIFIADRNYESYNLFEHVVHTQNKYIIRIKDWNSNGMLKGMHIKLTGECDIDVSTILTFKQTIDVKNHPEKYRFFPKKIRFDYLDKEHPYYDFQCRIIRFKLDNGTYECIATNLDRKEFSAKEIINIYKMRWGIETSFRELKYAIGLNAFHSKKRDFIKQEIYARLTLYNFCERIIEKVTIPSKKRKYDYQVNFTRTFRILREYLRIKKGGKHPPDVESIIIREIEPIRPGRSYPCKVRAKSTVYFTYRFN